MRSWLIVAADDEAQLAAAAGAGADAVAIDLDRGLSPGQRDAARTRTRNWIASQREQVLENRRFSRWVRISALGTQHWREDLAEALAGGPDGILLPDVQGPQHVQQLGAEFYEMEQRAGLAHGATRIVPLVCGTPASTLSVGAFAQDSHPRLVGLGWDGARLADALDTRRQFDEAGSWAGAFALARAQVLLAAKASALMAIESAQGPDTDPEQLAAIARAARADGFTGMFASHPAQVAAINSAFAPTEREIAGARTIVGQFEINPGAEQVALGDRMIDRSHYDRARKLLGTAEPRAHSV